MKAQTLFLLTLCAAGNAFSQIDTALHPNPLFDHWQVTELVPGGRFDAITSLNAHIDLAATRNPHPGHVFRSEDDGRTWTDLGIVTDTGRSGSITCIAGTPGGLAYLVTENSSFWRSEDFGKTWNFVTRLSSGVNTEHYALCYGLLVTNQGTVLVADANSSGGHIYRSTDHGLHFTDVGQVSTRALYRLNKAHNGVVVNGWKGDLYKSTDDGLTWDTVMHIDTSALFGIEYIGAATMLLSSQSGGVYRGSDDKWQEVGRTRDVGDDFADLTDGVVLWSTYTGSRDMFLTLDRGTHWEDIGQVPTGVPGDWLDHVIGVYDDPDSVTVLGGTHKGFILRASISRSLLYRLTRDSLEKARIGHSGIERDFRKSLIASLVDPRELDEPEDVLIDGDYAYIPCRDGHNVAIFDVRDPRHPRLVSSFRDPALLDAMGVAKNGRMLYITSMTNHAVVVADVSDPTHPVKVSSITIGGLGNGYARVRKGAYSDGYLYVAHSSEGVLYIVNVTDPAHPVVTGKVPTEDGAFAVFVKGNYAYVGGCFPGSSVKVIDVSDKAHPRLVETLSDPKEYGCTCSFQEEGDDLFATAYSSNTFMSFDVHSPLQPREIGLIQSPLMDGPNRIVVKGKYAFQINSIDDTFLIIDISDPVHPRIVDLFNDKLLRKVYGMDVKGRYAYMVGREAKSLVVLDLQPWLK